MVFSGKVVGGQYINATIDTNRKGELALTLGFKRIPNLTAGAVAAWEEIISETRDGAAGAVSNIGQAVARVTLPGAAGRAASAAVSSTVDSVMGATHTVRVDWVDGKQSLIRLPDKLFRHLGILLRDRQIATTVPPSAPASDEPTTPTPSGMIGQFAKFAGSVPALQVDVAGQIAKLAALRDQGALTEDEFAAKKTELLGRL